MGPYAIEAPVGAGGMGEVYRATDTRLDRTVAIKVLPEPLANDPALRERFEREARAVSSLNHPHICTLHDVGDHEGVHFLVMEYLEGETLAERLKGGALRFDEALTFAIQIADALDRAHGEGIVHRDLKPGNVMLTPSGVKLLDFGLAKTREKTSTPTKDSELPTQHKPLTDAGTILGTVQYMAPEQLEGKEVDARADVFSFGAMLYEMLTGERAFEGDSQASLISAIMTSEPRRPLAPPALDRTVKKCLAKDPNARWRSAHDVATQLQWLGQLEAESQPPTVSFKQRGWIPWAAAGLVVLATLLLRRDPSSEPATRDLVRFTANLEGLATTWAPGMALSPDGKYLVYRSATPTRLEVQRFDSLTSQVLDGSEMARLPFFSPDSRWVAFPVENELRKVPIEGGSSQRIGELPPGVDRQYYGTWNVTGDILLSTGLGLYRISADGGPYETIVEPDAASGILLHPQWLPDGRHALVTLRRGALSTIHLLDVETGKTRELIEAGSQASYLSSGHLVYRARIGVSSGASELYAVAFDIDELRVRGTPVTVSGPIYAIESAGGGYFTVSEAGHLAYLLGPTQSTSLVWATGSGDIAALDIAPGVFRRPSLAPDGRRVAVDSHVGGTTEHDIWIYDLPTGTRTRFTVPGHNVSPVWTPDGKRLAFSSFRPPNELVQSIYWQPTDRDGEAELLVALEFNAYPVSWTPDGKNLAFVVDQLSQDDVWVLPLGEDPRPLLATEFREHSPMFSPDGRWLAYVSDESGREEVYVRPFPGEGPKHAVSTSGGREPMWSRDGNTIFFRNVEGSEMWSADVELEPTFRAGKPVLLFTHPLLVDRNRQQTYDVSSDGERFLMVEAAAGSAQDNVVVVLNWVEELKRLVPTK